MMRISIAAFGLASGILWGVGIFLFGILAMAGYGKEIVDLMGQYYWGFSATLGGALIGVFWGFVDGYIGGVLFAWLYNVLAKRFEK